LLSEQIRRLEGGIRPSEAASIPLGAGLRELLPGGLAAGSLVELFPREPGAGAWTLALVLARYACGDCKTLLIADAERSFYPPAARKFGLDVARTVIVRPRRPGEALLALAQSLRCAAIGAAIGAFERLDDRDNRRLQLAAEAGGAVGILVRPIVALHMPSFAAVRLVLEPLPSLRGRRRVRVERPGTAVPGLSGLGVEIDDATGHVRAFSLLELAAHSATTA
jgi:hypothetical protein